MIKHYTMKVKLSEPLTDEGYEILFGSERPSPAEGRWRIDSVLFDNEVVEGDAVKVRGQLVAVVDGAWSVEGLEQWVAGSWRRRSVRDLLDAAGGDPL